MFTHIFATLILQFAVAVLTITILFFTIVKHVEKNILTSTVDNILKNTDNEIRFLDTFSLLFDVSPENNIRNQVLTSIKNVPVQDLKLDQDVLENNKNIENKSIAIMIIVVASSMLISYILYRMYNLTVKEVVIPALLNVVVIVGVEIFFLYMFISKYIVIDLNDIKKYILASISKKYLNIDLDK